MARTVDKEGTQKRKEQILKAAGKCFSKKGFHQSSMADICKRAKLSPGTVYHYFRSKDEMILHFAEQELEEAKKYAEFIAEAQSVEELVELTVDGIMESEERAELQFYLEVLTEGGRNYKVGKILLESELLVFKALKKQLKKLEVKVGRTPIKTLALFVGIQISALEIYMLENPSVKECKEIAKLSKKALLHVLTEL